MCFHSPPPPTHTHSNLHQKHRRNICYLSGVLLLLMVAALKWCYSRLSLSFFAPSVSFSSLLHSIFSPLLLWITCGLLSGGKIPPHILSQIRGGVMEFSITPVGAPFPDLPPPCEWEMISIPPPSISSSSPSALAAFPLPGTSLTLNWITLQLTLHPFLLRLTQTRILFTFASFLSVRPTPPRCMPSWIWQTLTSMKVHRCCVASCPVL